MKDPEKKPRRRVKKVKGHGGGHHGGSWKVAYADLVTALMALFMVLWLISQGDQKLKQSIANYFRSPGVFDTMSGGVLGGPTKLSKEPSPLTNKDNEQALYSTAELLQKKFQSRPEFSSHKDQIKVDMTDEGLRIQIVDKADRVSFGSASAQVTPEAEAILKEIALGICELPNLLRIGGHTDRHVFPPSSPYTNWELSADRANAARRVLNANCVRPEQISRIVGYADTELINPSDPYSHDNRRISIVVLRLKQAEAGDTSGSKQEGEGAGRVVEESPRDAAPKATPKSEDEEQPKGGDGESTRPAEATPKASGHADDGKHETDPKPSRPTRDGEKRLSSRKLADRNSVSVGTPDQIPANVQRLREPARPAKER